MDNSSFNIPAIMFIMSYFKQKEPKLAGSLSLNPLSQENRLTTGKELPWLLPPLPECPNSVQLLPNSQQQVQGFSPSCCSDCNSRIQFVFVPLITFP